MRGPVMKKTLLGGLVGGVILFVWSFLAWTVLPLHTSSLREIPNEEAVVSALKPALPSRGVYMLRHNPGMGAEKAAQDAWIEKIKQGPTGLIFYDPNGSDPMMVGQMVTGLIIDILSALVVAWLLTRSTALSASYLSRVMFCGIFAIFVTTFDYLSMWNWMGYPGDFTTGLVVDALIAWLLAGLGIAAIVKAPKAQPA
jgi:hypothetical protein